MEGERLPNWRYHAEGWAAAGFDPHMARRWRMAGFRAWEAGYWSREGFYPDEAWSAREAGLDWEMASQLSGLGNGMQELGSATPSFAGDPGVAGGSTGAGAGSTSYASLQASYAGRRSGTTPPHATDHRPSRSSILSILAASAAIVGISVLVGTGLLHSPLANHATQAGGARPAADMISSHSGIAQVMLDINPPPLYGKPAPHGGILQDAYVPARFTVKTGEHVDVTVTNFSTDTHSFTSAQLHLNVMIHPGSHSSPHVTTFQFVAPNPGVYYWHCIMPCGWGMHHLGYMMGEVIVVS
ncbi:MAG: cupredoxin domain-containing protein [Actinobacteria bacterium]|nr:cupredoxin domain-containing protein [Actinomycetota bacterium]MCL5446784.1 cupredoxin domain-containing protein [Actinomycetota bacterium]